MKKDIHKENTIKQRKCVTSVKVQYIYIIYILCVHDDSGDTQHKMKAGDVTV